MGGEERNVRAETLGNAILMRASWVQNALALIGSDQKAARPAGGIQDGVFSFANAKGVHYVHQIFVGVVLAKLVTLFRINNAFEDSTENVCRDQFKVER